MTVTDPIADLLTRIRNASRAQHRYVDIGWSKMKEEIAKVLKEEGFVNDYMVRKEGSIGTLRVLLRYSKDRESVVRGLKRVSKPGCRKYVQRGDITKVLGGLGISIVTTSKGVMTGARARQAGVGGETLCNVW